MTKCVDQTQDAWSSPEYFLLRSDPPPLMLDLAMHHVDYAFDVAPSHYLLPPNIYQKCHQRAIGFLKLQSVVKYEVDGTT